MYRSQDIRTLSKTRQQGAVLLISLILLVVTLVGASGMTSVTLGERMISNMQSANKAFEGAEAALAQCEDTIRTSDTSDLDVNGGLGVLQYDATNIATNRLSRAFWMANGTPLAAANLLQANDNPEGLVSSPRCAIEYVGKVSALEDLYEGSAVKRLYLVTAFSQGSDASTQAVVESVFVKQ